jgi:ribonuclease BN (tRNA processing enzyme)
MFPTRPHISRTAGAVSRRAFVSALFGSVIATAGAQPPAPRSRLILLGTAGGPTPKRTRSAPAQAVLVGDRTYIVDCGNGVARQLVLAGVPLATIRHVFLTHLHSDHAADYGTLLLLAWGDSLTTDVDTWGPAPLARMTRLFFDMSQPDLDVRERDEGRPHLPALVHPHEIRRAGIVMRDDRVTVTAALVDHPLVSTAFAYRFDCPDRAIVFSGDTRPSPALVALAKDADVLVHEVLLPDRLRADLPAAVRRHIVESHTAAEDVGRLAAAAGVKLLVLSHFVPSNGDPIPDEAWLAPVRRHFKGPVTVGHDLQEF